MSGKQRVQIISKDGAGYKTSCTNSETGEEIPHVFRVELTFDMREKEPYWQGRLYTYFPIIDIVGEMKMLSPICPCCNQKVPEELLNMRKLQEEMLEAISKIGTIDDDEGGEGE